ncbi:hypothetical protein DV738_g4101, partial [Chaetothyriales sp. CBS 135597]
MAAAQIPNLNTLRRGGLRGRGQGGGLRPPPGARGRRQPNSDEIICATDNDATTSRVSAVEAGYLDDPFAKLLSGVGEVARRLPLMNRDLVYHEIDLATNTRGKIARLRSAPTAAAIASLCGPNVNPLSPLFRVSEDGARLDAPGKPVSLLPGIDPTLPTLLISECCLIYLSPDQADAPILPHDAFGRTMISNLTARGIHLQTLHKYADLREQKKRLERNGFKNVD